MKTLLVGSNNSMLAFVTLLVRPPATNTIPFVSNVAVCKCLATLMLLTKVKASFTGL
jgi:hypothetical protein